MELRTATDRELKALATSLVSDLGRARPEERPAVEARIRALRDEMARRLEERGDEGGPATDREPRRPRPSGGSTWASAVPPRS